MPLYKYQCEKCGLNVEMIRPINERDNLEPVKKQFCSEPKKETDCPLKRVQVAGTFKI